MWQVRTSKIQENNMKGVGSVLKEPTLGRSCINSTLRIKKKQPSLPIVKPSLNSNIKQRSQEIDFISDEVRKESDDITIQQMNRIN